MKAKIAASFQVLDCGRLPKNERDMLRRGREKAQKRKTAFASWLTKYHPKQEAK